MIALLRHVLDPAYLYAQRGEPSAWGGVVAALLAGLLLAVALAWRRRRASPSDGAERWPWAASGGALLIAVALYAVGRVATGPLSARVWYLSALALAAALAAVAVARRPLARLPWLVRALDAATGRLRPDDPCLPWGATGALAAAHLIGVATLMAAGEAGWWLPALVAGCLAAVGWRRVEALTPLLLAYGGWALRALVGDALGVDTGPYLAFPHPDPWSPWFDGRATLLMGVGGTVLVAADLARRRAGRGRAERRRGRRRGAPSRASRSLATLGKAVRAMRKPRSLTAVEMGESNAVPDSRVHRDVSQGPSLRSGRGGNDAVPGHIRRWARDRSAWTAALRSGRGGSDAVPGGTRRWARGGVAWEAKPLVALMVAGGGLFWFAAAIAVHLSHGVTGSDALCYLQMATDLARHGDAGHTFPLATLLWESGLPAWPAVPVGYHPPDPTGYAVTVWPIGWPMALAGLIRLGGERLAMWGAPLCALLAAGLTYLLARELAEGNRSLSASAGALAAAILLTSREGALRALVPMADASAQALSVATILCLWRGRRRDSLAWSALAGISLAGAYWVRHPLLPLGLAALPAMLIPEPFGAPPHPWRRQLAHLAVFGTAALAVALPDLAYHRRAFGSIWTAESPEWFLLSWRHIGSTAGAVLRDGWLRREEFGYLAPFVLAGIVWQWRSARRRPAALTLWAGFGGVLLLNLAYSALRLRDLLSLFPWAALWAGWGMVALWRWATASGGSRLRLAAVLLAMTVALATRMAPSVALPWQEGVWTFGHVTAEQRAAFDALAEALPPDTVVATGLNAGAVTRYTGRDAVRPASWSDDEFVAFARLFAGEGRPLYLLVDGEEMEDVLARARPLLALEPAGVIDIPMMGRGGQWQEGPGTLYAAQQVPAQH